MTPEQQQAIAELRTRNVSPKQIARQLGLRPAEVSAFIQAQAAQTTSARIAAGELNPLFQCLVNQNCLPALTQTKPAPIVASDPPDLDSTEGFAIVMVARKAGFNRLEVCTYLMDIWCLGLKDVGIPRLMSPSTYKDFVDYAYQPFATGNEEISLELARAIVYEGIAYAAKLGFQPHKDFAQAQTHLGEWNGELTLTFGRNGKPFYINGPNDNPMKILRTLRETVGEGNFDYVIGDGS